MQPRTPTIATGAPSTAVSEQARSDPEYRPPTREARTTSPPVPGEPYHAKGWGATGTDGTPPPRSATTYRPAPNTAVDQAAANVIDLNPPTAQTPKTPAPGPAPEPPSPIAHPQPVTPSQQPVQTTAGVDRVAALENQVANLGTLLATVSNQLQNVAGGVQAAPQGTANPMAPIHHVGSAVQRSVPRVEGPVIPRPDPAKIEDKNAPKLPNQSKMPTLQSDEEEMSQADYIEKHFRMRDLSITQIAWICNMTDKDITDVLVELGYQLPDDLRT